ncbi:U2 snRNP complex subunit [Coemansia asiatica]|uniref:U2 small nuclear ribonucleoprotein A' n=1 Tax=Coemansia asiatica TaxID=1052880 RepID=A0A9W8CLE5_9FUNG|nr:U2 snRNP complex subunit [Coemansia asiatica]KAJ2869715.1 U2 snRNP complex subunit [Coemansia asiatica]
MKLTADLINNSPTYINAVKDRELDLSNNNIPLIENLGVTRDLNDSINLCDNSIRILGNFPALNRLHALYLANNRIVTIEKDLDQFVSHLQTLVLTNNDIADLIDLEPIAKLEELEMLSLINNPVMRKPNARLWCIWRFSNTLRVLDFEKVGQKERIEAKALFEGANGQLSDLAKSILAMESSAPASNVFVPGEGLDQVTGQSHEQEQEKTEEEIQKEQNIAELKARIREEMANVEAMEEFI